MLFDAIRPSAIFASGFYCSKLIISIFNFFFDNELLAFLITLVICVHIKANWYFWFSRGRIPGFFTRERLGKNIAGRTFLGIPFRSGVCTRIKGISNSISGLLLGWHIPYERREIRGASPLHEMHHKGLLAGPRLTGDAPARCLLLAPSGLLFGVSCTRCSLSFSDVIPRMPCVCRRVGDLLLMYPCTALSLIHTYSQDIHTYM